MAINSYVGQYSLNKLLKMHFNYVIINKLKVGSKSLNKKVKKNKRLFIKIK